MSSVPKTEPIMPMSELKTGIALVGSVGREGATISKGSTVKLGWDECKRTSQ